MGSRHDERRSQTRSRIHLKNSPPREPPASPPFRPRPPFGRTLRDVPTSTARRRNLPPRVGSICPILGSTVDRAIPWNASFGANPMWSASMPTLGTSPNTPWLTSFTPSNTTTAPISPALSGESWGRNFSPALLRRHRGHCPRSPLAATPATARLQPERTHRPRHRRAAPHSRSHRLDRTHRRQSLANHPRSERTSRQRRRHLRPA